MEKGSFTAASHTTVGAARSIQNGKTRLGGLWSEKRPQGRPAASRTTGIGGEEQRGRAEPGLEVGRGTKKRGGAIQTGPRGRSVARTERWPKLQHGIVVVKRCRAGERPRKVRRGV